MKFKVLWIAGLMLAATAGQVQAGAIVAVGSVNALTNVSQLSGILGTAAFDEGPTSGAIALNTYSAQGLTFHTGSLSSINFLSTAAFFERFLHSSPL